MQIDPMVRFRRWAAVAVGVAVFGYVAYAMFRGFSETAAELGGFQWALYVPVLALTAVNYGLRYAKWAWLLQKLGVNLPHRANLWVFAAGLAMVISPGKAGEVLKPWLVRTMTGTPMERTIPALIAERGTDGLAILILAAIGVSTYAADSVNVMVVTAVVCVAILGFIASETLSLGVVSLVERAGFVGLGARLRTAYGALRICLSPTSLFVLMGVSLVAWWAECVGYWLVFKGLGASASIGAATFLYSFATLFGGPSPGGLGMADTALVEGSLAAVPGLSGGGAIAGALLIRVATLWFGVLIGAVALMRIEGVIERTRAANDPPGAARAPANSAV